MTNEGHVNKKAQIKKNTLKVKKIKSEEIDNGKGLFKPTYQLNEELLLEAGVGDSDAEFDIGYILLLHNRTDLAKGFLKLSALKGHPKAKAYLKML